MPESGTRPKGFEPREWGEICGEATALFQALLRIDTTNPPGNETEAAQYLRRVLEEDGLEAEIIEGGEGRGNLVCRLESGSSEPPLLLATHLDVVPAGDLERWTHPPFAAELADGMIWGRGAVDMKNMVAMSAMVMKLLRRREARLRRDVIFAAVADEEAGCAHGSRFLVEKHPDKVRAGYALGEVGGYTVTVGRARVMLVQTAEKGICWLRIRVRGEAGHGSMPRRDSAVVRLSEALARLGAGSLPQHNTPVVEAFIRQAAAQLHNTVSPTVLRAGEKTNVIPDSAVAELDGRTLPGQRPEDLIAELRALVGSELDMEIEVIEQAPASVNHPPDSPLWDCIRSVVRRHDPGLAVLPYMIPGYTDAKYFGQLGARWYGFSPVRLEAGSGLSFASLFHGIDERIPEDGVHWGLQALHEVVGSFCVR